MNWFIITSNECNLCCEYCMNEPHPDLPILPSYSIEALDHFLSTDSAPTLAFYGGEPLLNRKLIEEVMDTINAKHYTIQTNGILLHSLPTEYLQRFSTILISIDGDEEITDKNRGKGIYKKLVKNSHNIRDRGFAGDLIARMAISKDADIYNDVRHLLETPQLTFDNVHWQIDCQWDDLEHTRYENFSDWIENYNRGITKLVEYWVEEMKKGKVKGIVPFKGIFRHILKETTTTLPCEAGLESFAIRTDGAITVCPLPPEYKFSVVGNISENKPLEVFNSVKISDPCPECDVYGLCGGRCLFANKTKLWGEEGFSLVCKTVKHLINELQQIKGTVLQLLENGIIKEDELLYPTYNNTTEIIP